MNKKKKTLFGTEIGFKQAFRYVLDVLCYAYYVKSDNLVSDICFDELEKIWMETFNEEHVPMRAIERKESYSSGVMVSYEFLKKEGKNG